MDFLNLADLPEVDSVKDGDTVFVVRDGDVCRVAKNKVGGGAGGYLLQVADEEYDKEGVIIYTPCDEAFETLKNGGNVTIAMSEALLDEELAFVDLSYMPVLNAFIVDGSAEGFSGEVAIVVANNLGNPVVFLLTNGQPRPTTANLTNLRSKLGGGKSVQL